MSKATRSSSALPGVVQKALRILGADIAVARRRRRISQKLMAEKMMVNVETVLRIEKGDPTVGIGIVSTALFVLGLTHRLEQLAAPSADALGQSEALRSLPKRVRTPKPAPDLDF